MNLHSEIMNIPVKDFKATPIHYGNYQVVYKLGHRDARHAAAELSLKAEARIDQLEEMLRWYIMEDVIADESLRDDYWTQNKHKAMKLLGMKIE